MNSLHTHATRAHAGTAPFFSLLFAYLLLGEALAAWTVAGMAVAFVGVIVILRRVPCPPGGSDADARLQLDTPMLWQRYGFIHADASIRFYTRPCLDTGFTPTLGFGF